MTLEDYNLELSVRNSILQRSMSIFDDSNSLSNDIAKAIKSIEIIYKPGMLIGIFQDFYNKLNTKLLSLLSSGTIDPNSLLYLTRGFQHIENDEKYHIDTLDINADCIIEDRVLESFDNKILEEFY